MHLVAESLKRCSCCLSHKSQRCQDIESMDTTRGSEHHYARKQKEIQREATGPPQKSGLNSQRLRVPPLQKTKQPKEKKCQKMKPRLSVLALHQTRPPSVIGLGLGFPLSIAGITSALITVEKRAVWQIRTRVLSVSDEALIRPCQGRSCRWRSSRYLISYYYFASCLVWLLNFSRGGIFGCCCCWCTCCC